MLWRCLIGLCRKDLKVHDPEPVERKVCHVCGSSLPVSAFWPDKRLPGGLKHICRRCEYPAVFGITLPRGVARKKSNRQSLVCKYGLETVEMLECEYRMSEDEARETVASAWLVGPPWDN